MEGTYPNYNAGLLGVLQHPAPPHAMRLKTKYSACANLSIPEVVAPLFP